MGGGSGGGRCTEPPRLYMEEFYLARRRLVEAMARAGGLEGLEAEVAAAGPLLAPMVATHGPAGVNVAPMMLTFLPRPARLGEALEAVRRINREYWGRGGEALAAAARFLLDYVYNPEVTDPLVLGTHLMKRGHTWVNVRATGEAAVGVLIPPDRGALELRARARVVEEGPLYEYVNEVHDLMHATPRGERSHPWYPALILEVTEVYDNSYQALGRRLCPP